jgi:predicted nucleic acid-binding protein
VILVDTSLFFPLLSARDRDHERVRAVFESLRGRRLADLLLTTNHVVGETITLARTRGDQAFAVHVGEYLYSEKIARIHWTTSELERAAFAYFTKHRDKHYSFRGAAGGGRIRRRSGRRSAGGSLGPADAAAGTSG